MTSTTIRVPRQLHDRLAERAARHGKTLAEEIEHVLDTHDGAVFWASVEATMASAEARAAMQRETESLGGTLADGLVPGERWDDVL